MNSNNWMEDLQRYSIVITGWIVSAVTLNNIIGVVTLISGIYHLMIMRATWKRNRMQNAVNNLNNEPDKKTSGSRE